MFSLALALFAPTIVAERTLDVVFIADAPAVPPLVIMAESAGRQRTLLWGFAGGASASGVLTDDAGSPTAVSTLPAAPAGATLVERGGAITIFLDDAGVWQEPLKVVPPGKAQALPVAEPRGLRLVVHGTYDSNPAFAVLYGHDVRITGRAVLRADRLSSYSVVANARGAWSGAGTVPSTEEACGRSAPGGLALVDAPTLALATNGPAVCVGPLALIPMTEVTNKATDGGVARGVSVVRPLGEPPSAATLSLPRSELNVANEPPRGATPPGRIPAPRPQDSPSAGARSN